MYERLDPVTKQQHYQNFLNFFIYNQTAKSRIYAGFRNRPS